MQKYFHEVKKFVETRAPEFRGHIRGDLYPPPQYAILLNTLCGYLWFIGISFLFAGSSILKYFGIDEPWWMVWINSNRLQCFMALFLLNSVASSLIATGAFEIYLDGDLVFSKLESKRFPSAEDLLSILSRDHAI